MGASESTLSSSQSRPADEITTVSELSEVADPILERLKSFKISTPLLTSPPKIYSVFVPQYFQFYSYKHYDSVVDPKVLLELFSMYREWQEENVKKLSRNRFCQTVHSYVVAQNITELYPVILMS
ncbi:hypothetical protein M0R45_004019 [Rubus argutus]|uniref:Uncharacterized protein n=1 Tax=Rubus argutus TaxID=59490 RepID=A0AAW1YII7_RUBAR